MCTAPGTEGEGRLGPDPTVCALLRALGLVLINKTFGPGLRKLAQVQKEEMVRPCSSADQTAVGEPGAPSPIPVI